MFEDAMTSDFAQDKFVKFAGNCSAILSAARSRGWGLPVRGHDRSGTVDGTFLSVHAEGGTPSGQPARGRRDQGASIETSELVIGHRFFIPGNRFTVTN
jgi:hypothetical protein